MIGVETKSKMTDEGSQLAWISALRVFGALLVFLSHLAIIQSEKIRFMFGRPGVVVFFLMTGYLGVNARIKRTRKQYLFNRFIRMYPVYWLLLFLYSIIKNSYGLKTLIWNVTMLEDFVGVEEILGASWMMPIQVGFFGLLCILTVNFLKENKDNCIILMTMLSICALLVGLVRFVTNIPLPTAFFLLMMVGILGINFRNDSVNDTEFKRNHIIWFIFEFGFNIAAFLSYRNRWVLYFIAYHFGILIFYIVKRINWSNRPLQMLGKIGFPFFLGAEIPYVLVLSLIHI